MLSETKKQELIKIIREEMFNHPNKAFWGLYKDYSNCKGTIYGQKDNIYLIVTSSFTYVNQLKDSGYTIYIQGKDDKLIKIEV